MTLIPLDIPAGFYRNGTEYEQSGRWRDGSLVRWRDNSLRPIGGWRIRQDASNPSNDVTLSTHKIRGTHSWTSLDASSWFAGGSYDELVVMTAAGTVYNVTPAGLTDGNEDAAVETGYGYSFYGTGFYGQPRPDTGNYSEATTWSIDNWGEDMIAVSSEDGTIWYWDKTNPSTAVTALSNAPTSNLSAVVTEERFIFALGADGNARKVQWCNKEDATTWTAAATNEAGDIELQTSGQIMQGVRTRGQVLILTDIDAHTAQYLGPPYVYGFQRVATNCGAISRKAAVDTPAGVFWMGQRSFHMFDGNSVQEIPCDVHDYVFNNLNDAQQSKIWAFSNGQYGEIWWFYPSSTSTEIDSYVAYDFKENHWLIGSLARTSGVSRGVFKHPFLMGTDNKVYEHEVGYNVDSGTVYAETGPISIGNGDQTMHVTQLIPDEVTQGDVDVTFKTRFYPNDTEREYGPYTPANPTSVRFSGRQVRMRVTGDQLVNWKLGTMRLDVKPAGRR